MRKYATEYADPETKWSRWIQPVNDNYKLACCDCGLVHRFEFRVADDGQVDFRVRRMNRETAGIRRGAALKIKLLDLVKPIIKKVLDNKPKP